MAIVVNLDVMMAKRKISLKDLAEKIDITNANLSILKTGKAKAIRFTTLNEICKALDCQPGDILEYVEDKNDINRINKGWMKCLYIIKVFILMTYFQD